MTRGGDKGLMSKSYFNETLGKAPIILSTFQRSYQTKHRKSIWIEKMTWWQGEKGGLESRLWISPKVMTTFMNSPLYIAIETCCCERFGHLYFYPTRVRSLSPLVTHWLTNRCLRLDLCDPGVWRFTNSKLVEFVIVTDVDADDHVGKSLLQIWKLRQSSTFVHRAWSIFWGWSSGKILKLEFVPHFAADVL